jgi:hypothetical protein
MHYKYYVFPNCFLKKASITLMHQVCMRLVQLFASKSNHPAFQTQPAVQRVRSDLQMHFFNAMKRAGVAGSRARAGGAGGGVCGCVLDGCEKKPPEGGGLVSGTARRYQIGSIRLQIPVTYLFMTT